jgi:hypothetical protein
VSKWAGVSDEITLNLTPAQVREVLRQAAGETLVAAGLLDQNPATRRYCCPATRRSVGS